MLTETCGRERRDGEGVEDEVGVVGGVEEELECKVGCLILKCILSAPSVPYALWQLATVHLNPLSISAAVLLCLFCLMGLSGSLLKEWRVISELEALLFLFTTRCGSLSTRSKRS